MKKYEIIFKAIVLIILIASVTFNILTFTRNGKLADKIAEVSSNHTRVEAIQSELRREISNFGEGYKRLGESISTFEKGFSELGNTLSQFDGTIQNINIRVSNLTDKIQSIARGLPEVQTIVRESGDRISEAERILQELIDGNY
jgi:methyl-accepting chemotaxis protein